MSEHSWLDDGEEEMAEPIRNAAIAEAQRAIAPMRIDEANAQLLITAGIRVEKPAIPEADAQKQALFDSAWRKLTTQQKAFLAVLKQVNFSERAAVEALHGTDTLKVSRTTVRHTWAANDDFEFCRKVMQQQAYLAITAKERLVARADEVAERAMESRPILHKGVPTGFYEFQGDLVLRANEQIMKVAGHLKNAEATRVRVRIVNLAGPDDDKVIDGTAVEVEAEVPSFLE